MACFEFKNIFAMSNFYHRVAKCSAGDFAVSSTLKFLSIFVHIPPSSEPITLIWVSLERSSFLLQNLSIDDANFGQRWCQNWNTVNSFQCNILFVKLCAFNYIHVPLFQVRVNYLHTNFLFFYLISIWREQSFTNCILQLTSLRREIWMLDGV